MKPVTGFKFGSKELRQHLAQKTREQFARDGHPRGMLGKHHTPENLAKTHAGNRRYWDEMTPEKLAERNAKMIAGRLARHGVGNVALKRPGFYTNKRGGARADIGDQVFKSAWEANYARYLNFLIGKGVILDWVYEPETIVFPGRTSGVCSYTPDFRVTTREGWRHYHEVKGVWTDRFDKQLELLEEFRLDVCPLHIIDKEQYRTIERCCRGLIPNWESERVSA